MRTRPTWVPWILALAIASGGSGTDSPWTGSPGDSTAGSRGGTDAATILARALPSVVILAADKGDGISTLGTGFVLTSDGIVVTAFHVIRGARGVTVRVADGRRIGVSGLVDSDAARDVALLRIQTSGWPAVSVRGGDPPVGCRAFVIGSPRGRELAIREGVVSRIVEGRGPRWIQFTCSATPGFSGGPLVDSSGAVIGVVSAQRVDDRGKNFAAPIDAVLALDRTLPAVPWGLAGRAVRPRVEEQDDADR